MPVIPKPVLTLKCVSKDKVGYFSSTLYYEPTGASVWTQANVDTFGQGVCNTLGPLVTAIMSHEANLVHWYVRLRTATQDLETYITSGDAVGDGQLSGQALPSETCLEIQRRTGKPGRNMRGRTFWSGIPEDGTDAGLIEDPSDFKEAAQNLAAGLAIDLTSGAFTAHARHWNRKSNTLEVVTQCRPVFPLVSRRDRRALHNLQPF